MIRPIFIAAFVASLAALLQAQSPQITTLLGGDPGDGLGARVCGAGDLNGDGHPDYLILSITDDTTVNDVGIVRAHSGVDGSLLFAIAGNQPADFFSSGICGIGDVNGDGHDDVLIGTSHEAAPAAQTGAARVYSGLDGSLIRTHLGSGPGAELGRSVAATGDLDGDGVGDYAIGSPLAGATSFGSGHVDVFSGVDGSVIYAKDFINSTFGFGHALAGGGDVNGDGVPDFIIGSPADHHNGPGSGSIQVFSGATGNMLYFLVGDDPLDQFGAAVSFVGDVDGDGRDDYVVGSPLVADAATQAGAVTLHSGVNGAVLWSRLGSVMFENLGIDVCGLGDVDGDAVPDFAVGAIGADGPPGSLLTESGRVDVHSGRDGSFLHSFYGTGFHDLFGISIAGLGDLNGDGFGDLIIGANGNNDGGADAGAAYVITMPTLPLLKYLTTSGASHLLDLAWSPDGGLPSALSGTITTSGGTPGGSGYLIISAAKNDELYFGFLPGLIDFDPQNIVAFHGFGFDAQGLNQAFAVSRQNPFLAGTNVYLQAFEATPILASSPALRIAVVP